MEEIKVITIDDDEAFLRQVSAPVQKGDPDLEHDISVLERYSSSNAVMAMAAVQLGIPKRLIYLKNTDIEAINRIQRNEASEEDENRNEGKVLINPVFLAQEGLTEYWEACASGLIYCGRVQRPYRITIEYYDTDFNKHVETIEGFPATVICHEMHHLDGIFHMDVALEVLKKTPEERKALRREQGYNILATTGDYESLKEPNKNPARKLEK